MSGLRGERGGARMRLRIAQVANGAPLKPMETAVRVLERHWGERGGRRDLIDALLDGGV